MSDNKDMERTKDKDEVFQELKIFEGDNMKENEEVMNIMNEVNEEKYEVIRITSLKSNGSVWTKQYNGDIDYNLIIPILIEKFPHVILSRQVLRQAPMDYLLSMKDDENKE